MTVPFDVSQLRKELVKSVSGIGVGTHDPTHWVSLGNYVVNWLITGDFYKGLPLGKVLCLAGESGAGKSYFAINAVGDALRQGFYVILMDSENALDAQWMDALGVNPEHPQLLKIDVAEINSVAATISNFFEKYKKNYADIDADQRPGFLIVVDSLGMLLSPTDVEQFEAGNMKGDKGLRAKMLYALIRNCVNKFGNYNIGMLATNHTYESQSMYEPGQKMSGGGGFWFASSIVLMMQKLKLRENDSLTGIRSAVTQKKSRFNHKGLNKRYDVYIRTESGMDPYSGLYELLLDLGILTKQGKETKVRYISPSGEQMKFSKREITHEIFDMMMSDWNGKLPTHDAIEEDADARQQQRDEDDTGNMGAHEGVHSGEEA